MAQKLSTNNCLTALRLFFAFLYLDKIDLEQTFLPFKSPFMSLQNWVTRHCCQKHPFAIKSNFITLIKQKVSDAVNIRLDGKVYQDALEIIVKD